MKLPTLGTSWASFLNIERPSPDHGRIKATGRQGYSQFIWPESQASFDLFGIDVDSYPETYLLSESDIRPRRPIISTHGTYLLEYEIYAAGFPKLIFTVELCLQQGSANLILQEHVC
jgi:hypothetical protein